MAATISNMPSAFTSWRNTPLANIAIEDRMDRSAAMKLGAWLMTHQSKGELSDSDSGIQRIAVLAVGKAQA